MKYVFEGPGLRKRTVDSSRRDAISDRVESNVKSRQEDGQFVVALARGMELLAAFRSDDKELSNAELAKRTGYSKPTITRLTFTLMKTGYLRYNEHSGNYALGPRVISLASPYLNGLSFLPRIQPELQHIADISGTATAVATRRNLEMIYLGYYRSAASLGLLLELGSSVPIVSTSHGRAYLAQIEEDEREEILAELEEQFPAQAKGLRGKIAEFQQALLSRGYHTACGEWNPNVNAVATAFRLPGSKEVFTINCGGHVSQLTPDVIERIGPYLKRLRDLLSGAK